MKANVTQPDYRELIDNLTGVIYTTDIQGQIEFASAGVLALTGYTPEELVGQHFSLLVDPEELQKVYGHYNGQVRTVTRETILEFRCLTRTGEKKWVEQMALLLTRKDGSQGFQCFVRDISEKRDVQRQLISAKTEAEEARRLQEQFLANMSHEIRTPMNGIVGMTNLLLETQLTTQQEQFAGVIRRSADNLLVIVNDILDLSKIKAGKLTIEKIPFRPQDVTANIWALFEQRIFKKGLQFSMELDPAIPASLVGDPHRLNQVLINLVGNAVKFTEKGNIKLTVAVEKQDSRSVSLLFTVTDTGIGIAAEQLPHVFDSFSQAGADITRKYGGTGLGLTICHQLLLMQGGTIAVESEPGNGTAFSFRLTYCRDSVRTTATPQNKNAQDTQAAFEGKQFLVVEDNPINQQLIVHVIKKAGAQVTVADNGREAIAQLEKQRFDLIVMDLQMPVMDGYETTKYLRETMKLLTPIFAMTANALKGEQVRCLEAGMNGYMSKPFDFHDFYNKVAELLDSPHQGPTQNPEDPQDNSTGLFNLSLLEEIGDKDYVRDTVATLLDALPHQLAEIQKAFVEKNYDRLAYLAHKLKGTMGVFQARMLTEQLDKIEALARERRDPGGLVPVTLNLFRKLDRDLRRHDCQTFISGPRV
ncbi:MAG TPA: ATP-binding protein [Puia sp.]|nr:ATP-binding protein [Puia sp.]